MCFAGLKIPVGEVERDICSDKDLILGLEQGQRGPGEEDALP